MKEFFEKIDNLEFNEATELIWKKIGALDARIQEAKPWESKDKEVISELVLELYSIALMLNPFMPKTSDDIKAIIKANKKPEAPLFLRHNA